MLDVLTALACTAGPVILMVVPPAIILNRDPKE